jgi:adenylate cyclase
MPQVYYLPDEQLVNAGQAYTLLDVSLAAEIPHTHICGGNARCSTCRVLILEGLEHCAPRNAAEQTLATQLRLQPEIRLACQTTLVGEGRITLRRLSLDMQDDELFYDQATNRIAPRSLGQEQQVAILFADIRGFTAFSEALLPYDVIYVLNRYFYQMEQVIDRQQGMITVYMGDGLMALFGLDDPTDAVEQAVRAGVEMLEALKLLNPSLEMLYQRRLRIGIGIHYGWVVVGTVGGRKYPQMTAIGDAVNLASRIESANKRLGTTFLISDAAYQEVQEQVIGDRCFDITIPGKSGQYCVYEVLGMTPAKTKPMLMQPVQTSPTWLRAFQRWLNLLWQAIKKRLGDR